MRPHRPDPDSGLSTISAFKMYWRDVAGGAGVVAATVVGIPMSRPTARSTMSRMRWPSRPKIGSSSNQHGRKARLWGTVAAIWLSYAPR